jgi:hypothetical protein
VQPRLALLVVVLAGCPAHAARPPLDLTSTAERSGWKETGRHAEAVRLCRDLAASHPAQARCEQFGTSPEGRAMVALVMSARGLEPKAGRPVILIEGGIHAGEIEGKDAGFWLARDVLEGKAVPGVLDAATIVFVPIFNVDGHERFGPNNRPNQRGPVEMGFRTTGAALNLNRDFVKADAPEMAALLGLWKRWDPTLFIDLHTTDGAKFEHDVAVLVAPRGARADGLDEAAAAFSTALLARVTALGHLPLAFYPSFQTDDDPSSGFADGEAPPRFSQYYAAARNRLGILVETHSWRTYPERVKTTRDVLAAVFERAIADAASWRKAEDDADAADLAIGGTEVALLSSADDTTRTIDFRGYHYERVPSDVSGGTWTKYDESQPEIWKIPLRDHLVPVISVTAPKAGYVIPAGFAAVVAERLDRHGLRYSKIADVELDAEVWRDDHPTFGKDFEGRHTLKLAGAWTRERRHPGAGAIFVPIAQPGARLVMQLLEPTAPDALVNWGLFNAAFEQKEYMESYVAEELARTMLQDPAVKAAFDEALRDKDFAASPARRLDWFYRRSPAWDERVGLVPVFRVDVAPPPAP